MATHQKGINFKQTPDKKILLIHPDTLIEYLSQFPRTDKGWIAFDFQLLGKLTSNNLFAQISPIKTPTYGGQTS